MKGRRVVLSRSLFTALGAILVAAGLWLTACGVRDRHALCSARSLAEATEQTLRPGSCWRGTVTRLLSAPGKGAGAGRLWPVAGTDALRGDTAYIIPVGDGTGYAVLHVPEAETADFAADEAGRLTTPYTVLARVRAGLPTELDAETVRGARGAAEGTPIIERVYLVVCTEGELRETLWKGLPLLLSGALLLGSQRMKGVKTHE